MDCLRHGFQEGKVLGGRFRTVSPLNHGSFGLVFVAKDTQTGDDVAVKCITKSDAARDDACPAAVAVDDRSEELDIHSHLRPHANIVNLVHTFESAAHQYMVLELCTNGDLYEAIRAGKGPLETEHVRSCMLELVDAVDHLHSNGIYHRDVKPENIFLTSSGSMKLGDFGLATKETWSTEFAVGSDRYMAPEQYNSSVYGYGYAPAAADIWAIGIVLLNVLFQRNPFATPTIKDPLFQDFARDRNSLFDVFPNMSQDTADVLVHSLALDPADRSLGALREALMSVKTFTTDDEALDEFCTDQDENVSTATAAREPLRTPSITSPSPYGDGFPWALALKSPHAVRSRQLSTIRDDEPDLFPGSDKTEASKFDYLDVDEASLTSNVDSGLGVSYKSAASSKRVSKLVGSLPISFTRPANRSPYPDSGCSKSWSDLWDEDHERVQHDGTSSATDDVENLGKPCTPQLSIITEDGNSTPRQPLSETDANSRAVSPLRRLIEQDRAASQPSKQQRTSFFDKWAALGNFRRAKQSAPTSGASLSPAPSKTKYVDAFASIAGFGSNKKQRGSEAVSDKTREPSSNWRQGGPQRLRSTNMNIGKAWDRKEVSPTHSSPSAGLWALDNNWRAHRFVVSAEPSPSTKVKEEFLVRKAADQKTFLDTEFDEDIGDLEWVGGWHDFN